MLNRKRATVCRIGIGLIAVLATTLTSACAAGKEAQTAEEIPAIDGTSASVGQIRLDMFALNAPGDDATSHAVGSDVRVRLVLTNDSMKPDTLTDVSTPAAAGWAIYNSSAEAEQVEAADEADSGGTAGTTAPTAPPSGATSVKVPAGKSVGFDTPSSSKVMLLLNLSKKLYPGMSVPITVTFSHSGSKTIVVPVQLTKGQSRLTVPPGSQPPRPE